MLVYRLENEEGEGVYGRGFAYSCTRSAIFETMEVEHPAPEADRPLVAWWEGAKLSRPKLREWENNGRREWQCAFESREQLEAWFPKEGLELMKSKADRARDSMAVVVYKLPAHKTKRGEFQTMYHEPSKVFVERISLADFIASL